MARIRTIKPDFFTSEDIVQLSPLARLLYIALWCEADRDGRMKWIPRTYKIRYFPADDCDIQALCGEIVSAGLVVLYGDSLAYIPSFPTHQHINPRESLSILPGPDGTARVSDASARVSDVQGGKEGKGKEGEKRVKTPKTCLPADFQISDSVKEWAAKNGHTRLDEHFESFKIKAVSKGYEYASWDAAFMGAVREDWARLGPANVTPIRKARKELGA